MNSTESADTPDGEFERLRDEMYRLLGKCMVRLQTYEAVAKFLASRREVSSEPAKLALSFEGSEATFASSTLGPVVDEIVNNVIVGTGWEPPERNDNDPAVYFNFSIALPVEVRRQFAKDHRDLVKLRNSLVHGFAETQDLLTDKGLTSAISHLDESLATIEAGFSELRQWCQTFQNLGTIQAVVLVLHAAEADLAEGGWTRLSAAANIASEQIPGVTPQSLGFVSWPHLVHEAGFELRRVADSNGTRAHCYRSRK